MLSNNGQRSIMFKKCNKKHSLAWPLHLKTHPAITPVNMQNIPRTMLDAY